MRIILPYCQLFIKYKTKPEPIVPALL